MQKFGGGGGGGGGGGCPEFRRFTLKLKSTIEVNCRPFSVGHMLMQFVLNFEILNYENHIFECNNSPTVQNIEFLQYDFKAKTCFS